MAAEAVTVACGHGASRAGLLLTKGSRRRGPGEAWTLDWWSRASSFPS